MPRTVPINGRTQSVSGRTVGGTGIPDSVIQRNVDDGTFSFSDARGVQIDPNVDFGTIRAEISSQTSGLTTAYVYDLANDSLLNSVDISGKSSGDIFEISASFQSGESYSLVCDAGGASYTLGALNGSADNSYTSSDFDTPNSVFNSTNNVDDSVYGNIVRWGGI